MRVNLPPMMSLNGMYRRRSSRQRISRTCRSLGAVVITTALSYDINHQMMATAAVKVLPAPLQDRTATWSLVRRASRISACLSQGLTPRMLVAKLMGLARIHRWSLKASLAGGTGFRAASDRMMLLGLGSAFAGPGFAGFWGMNRYGFWVLCFPWGARLR